MDGKEAELPPSRARLENLAWRLREGTRRGSAWWAVLEAFALPLGREAADALPRALPLGPWGSGAIASAPWAELENLAPPTAGLESLRFFPSPPTGEPSRA